MNFVDANMLGYLLFKQCFHHPIQRALILHVACNADIPEGWRLMVFHALNVTCVPPIEYKMLGAL